VAGVDEAGRGPLAGPVVAAAAILPLGVRIECIKDSKLLGPEQREALAARVRKVALAIAIGGSDHEEVDELNIAVAGRRALCRAIEALEPGPDYVLVDGFHLPELSLPHEAMVKGDRRSVSIMAAAIIAKTTRVDQMRKAALNHPGYGFESHFGYATLEHATALRDLGPCPIHRRTFAPVAIAERIVSGELAPAGSEEEQAGLSQPYADDLLR